MCSVKSSCTALNRDDVYRDSEEKDVIQKDVIPRVIKSLGLLFSCFYVSLYHCELKILQDARRCLCFPFLSGTPWFPQKFLTASSGRTLSPGIGHVLLQHSQDEQHHRHILILPRTIAIGLSMLFTAAFDAGCACFPSLLLSAMLLTCD